MYREAIRRQWLKLKSCKEFHFALLAAMGLAQTGLAGPTADCRITNSVLTVATSTRDAGAICSIVFAGKELVNDYDHGRQVQVAWTYNNLGESYNPTEAGARGDGLGNVSSSTVVAASATEDTLATTSHPAHWWYPGTNGNPGNRRADNTAVRTKDTLKKTITLGYAGDPHVIVFDTEITVSAELTGPAPKEIRTQVPACYTGFELTEHALFNRTTGVYQKSSAGVPQGSKDRQRVPIINSLDGRYAVGMYTAQAKHFLDYTTRANPRPIPGCACHKLTLHFEHPVQVGRTYAYRSFLVIGDLETVKASLKKLPGSQP